jgi:aspartate/methionine/tyrosine aminotransferase
MRIETFEMERTQCLYENIVELNLSESGVLPLRVEELLEAPEARERFLALGLSYAESDGSRRLREHIAQFYPDCTAQNVTVTNGGSEANYVTLWALLGSEGRLACMLPNYLQGWGLGRAYAAGADAFRLVVHEDRGTRRWALDLESLERAVRPDTTAILVCNPNNPTGAVLTETEMDAVIAAARRVGAWIVADEIYRGAEVDSDEITPTFWGRYERVVITSGLSKAFGMPGLRIGWVVAPQEFIARTWIRHDYLTLTPGLLGDQLATIAMEPARRDSILARTRRIIRKNLPVVERWLDARRDRFRYVRPRAGAIAYFEYSFDLDSIELNDRLRREQSVLFVPGDHFGVSNGLRVGFGYDADKTAHGLDRLATLLAAETPAAGTRRAVSTADT